MPQPITLYHYWRSSCSWRVRWALALKKLQYQSVSIDLKNGEQKQASYLKVNPAGTVPTLLVKGQSISDSLAIIEWLEETYPKPALLPQDPWSRARVRELCGHINSIQAVQNLKVLQKVSSDPKMWQLWAKHFIEEGLLAFEKKLQIYAGSYSFGGQLTAADLFLIPQMYNAKRFGVDTKKMPIAERIYMYCLQQSACDEASPQKQPGAVP